MSILPGSRNRRFIGRQAILDSNLKLYGYELLFRAGAENVFSGGAEEASNQVIDSCISMAACCTSKNLFINCTRDVLLDMRVKLLPAKNTVLEILETIEIDELVVQACKELKRAGFRLALDDFLPNGDRQELVGLAEYVKVDFRNTTAEMRQEIYQSCRGFKVKFIAEKVETASELEQARAEGNVLFQGYFHSRPEVISEAQIPARKLSYLRILALLTQYNVDHTKVREVLLTEPSLCYRLLRLANSALYGLKSPVNSLQGALLIVGEETFRKMVMVALIGMLPNNGDNRNITQTLERAYFCESMAQMFNERPSELYMLGMLSKINTLLGMDMTKLVELIPVSPRMEKALLGSPEDLGKVLEVCRYYEDWSVGTAKPHADITYQQNANLYFDAILSAGKALRELSATG